MNQAYVPITRSALKYGLYVGIASVIFYFLILLGWMLKNPVTSLSNVILIMGMIYAMREHKSLNEGYMSYAQGLSLGTLISVIAGLMVALLMSVYLSIDTQLLERELQSSLDNNEKVGEMLGYSDEMLDEMESSTRTLVSPTGYFILYIISYLISGFFFTLIVAAFQRKKRDIFSE